MPRSSRSAEGKPKPKANTQLLKNVLPEVWALIKPRWPLLAAGLVLMAINRVSGLVLPWSTKYLIDDVIGKQQTQLLTPLITAVITATIIQGLTSFSLTQLLSKAAQRLIAELR
ncbi:MAG: ABC transporter ATP-binding protein, partial [Terriglobales bacterium]